MSQHRSAAHPLVRRQPARRYDGAKPPSHPVGSARRWVAVFSAVVVVALSTVALATSGLLPSSSSQARSARPWIASIDPFNGSFDQGLQGWFVNPQATLASAAGRIGGASARVVNTDGADTTVLNDLHNSVDPTQQGVTYSVSAWVRTDTPGISVAVRLMEFPTWKPEQDNSLRGQEIASLWMQDTQWHQLQVGYMARETGTTLDLNILGWKLPVGAGMEVDDIVITRELSEQPPGQIAPPQPIAPTATVAQPAPKPTPSTRPTPRAPRAAPTRVNPALAASLPQVGKGAVFGFWQAGGGDFAAVEQRMRQEFGAAHRYYDFNAGQMWPTAQDRRLVDEGKLLHVSWETLSYQGGYDPALQPAPAVTAWDAHSSRTRRVWSYHQITNGSLDRYLDTMAQRVKQIGKPIIIDFNHEADDLPAISGSNTQRQAAGSPQEYAAAYRYLVQRFRAQGVTNVVWAITWSGWSASNPSTWWVFQQSWPGQGYVNLILWDPYNNKASNWRSFAQIVRPMYQALQKGMLDPVDPTAKYLRYGLGEFGSVPDGRRSAWLRSIPDQLKQFPQLTYVNYYSSGGWGTLHDDPDAITALGSALRDPYITE